MRTRVRLHAAITAVAVLGGLALAVPALSVSVTPGTRAPTNDSGTVRLQTGQVVPLDWAERTKAQETAYRNQISRLSAQGKLTPSIMAQMGLRQLTPSAGMARAVPAPAAPRTKPGGITLTSCSISNAQTSGNAMSVPAPSIDFSSGSSGYIYYANASYTWKSPPLAPSTCNVPVGGVDGFAVTLSKSAVNLGVSFYACNLYGKCGEPGYLETNSQYGGGWAFQDYADSAIAGYSNTYTATLTYSFRIKLGTCVQAFSKYAHTWNSTAVNGFSIGPWSIGVQWSSSSANWTRASQAGSRDC